MATNTYGGGGTYSPGNTGSEKPIKDRAKLGDLRDDVATIGGDVAHLASDARDLAASTIESGASTVKHTVDNVRKTAMDVGEQAKSWHTTMNEYVTKHPTSSVLIAVGIGALIGRAMPR